MPTAALGLAGVLVVFAVSSWVVQLIGRREARGITSSSAASDRQGTRFPGGLEDRIKGVQVWQRSPWYIRMAAAGVATATLGFVLGFSAFRLELRGLAIVGYAITAIGVLASFIAIAGGTFPILRNIRNTWRQRSGTNRSS